MTGIPRTIIRVYPEQSSIQMKPKDLLFHRMIRTLLVMLKVAYHWLFDNKQPDNLILSQARISELLVAIPVTRVIFLALVLSIFDFRLWQVWREKQELRNYLGANSTQGSYIRVVFFALRPGVSLPLPAPVLRKHQYGACSREIGTRNYRYSISNRTARQAP